MMKYLTALLLVALLAGGVYLAWQEPRVRDLFRTGDTPEDPLGFLKDLPDPEIPEESPRPRRRGGEPDRPQERSGTTAPARVPSTGESEESASAGANLVPNEEVGRVLMQILRAQGLADGISLSVSDEEVAVYGAVPSQDVLQRIIEVIEKGRESRRVNTDEIHVTGR